MSEEKYGIKIVMKLNHEINSEQVVFKRNDNKDGNALKQFDDAVEEVFLSAPKQTGQTAVEMTDKEIEKEARKWYEIKKFSSAIRADISSFIAGANWFKQKLSLPDIQAGGKGFTIEDMRKCFNAAIRNVPPLFETFDDYLKQLHY